MEFKVGGTDLTNITPGADGMRLVVGKIICEHQTQTNAACE